MNMRGPSLRYKPVLILFSVVGIESRRDFFVKDQEDPYEIERSGT
jgi:hypothetical protein